jgi:hypothetical protein
MSFQDLEQIITDKSFGNDNEKKVEHYAAKFPLLVKEHPMSLIYCCSRSDDVNDCIKLLVVLSKVYDHDTTHCVTEDILELVEFIMSSDKHTINIIFESETKYLKTIVGSPLICFKVCNERTNFNKQQLEMMLSYRDKVKKNELSQYDASVDVGTVLVDKYVKPNLKET